MKIDFGKIASKLIVIVPTLVHIVEQIKGAGNGQAKKAEVIKQIPELLELGEFAVDRDVFNDPNILVLVDALVDAEAAVQKARAALRAGLLNHPSTT